jgi:hypothetical protein
MADHEPIEEKAAAEGDAPVDVDVDNAPAEEDASVEEDACTNDEAHTYEVERTYSNEEELFSKMTKYNR